MPEDQPDRELLRQTVGWAVGHVEVDVNFEGLPLLLAGDPTVLASADQRHDVVDAVGWAWVVTPVGSALAIRGPDRTDADGPFVWVVGSDDGPMEIVAISPRSLDTSEIGTRSTDTDVGSLDLPSGRLIVGSPESIGSGGADVDTIDRPAEFRVFEGSPGPLRDGYAVIVRASARGRARVLISSNPHTRRISSITIELPTPSWLPQSSPVIDRRPD